jgi:hypothetical protein
MQKCDEEHGSCRKLEQDISSAYPSRLLDLSDSTQDYIKLVIGKTVSAGAKYATLSHCWGNVKQAVLLKSNLKTYSDKIPLDSLPQTFSDAVKVCSDLGIRYLWIDSLCIIQDDQEDWAAEAPRMADVYSNSDITLAASASRSDWGGLHRPLDRSLVSPFIFKIVDGTGAGQHFSVEEKENFESYVNNAPLNQRAWVLQERALSRRILHFANDQLYWQCASEVDAQFDLRLEIIDPILSPWISLMQWNKNLAADHELKGGIRDNQSTLIPRSQPEDHPLLTKWDDLVQTYSKCQLTYVSDKLIAVSGLARRIQMLTGWPESDYLAGLWRQGLPRRLLWSRLLKPCSLQPNVDVPSWSWAHLNGDFIWPPIIWTEGSTNKRGNIMVDILNASTTPTQTALGSVKGGTLTLRALLCQAKLRRSLWEDWHFASKVFLDNKWVDVHQSFEAYFDLKTSRWEFFGRNILFMPILNELFISPENAENPGERRRTFHGLMLEPTGAKNGQYRRVGCLRFTEEAYDLVGEALFSNQLDKTHFFEISDFDRVTTHVIEIV